MKPLGDLFVKGEVVEVVADFTYAAQSVQDKKPGVNGITMLVPTGTRGTVITNQIKGSSNVRVKLSTHANCSWFLFDHQIDVSSKYHVIIHYSC